MREFREQGVLALARVVGVKYPGDPSQKEVDSLLASISLGIVTGYIKKLEQQAQVKQEQPNDSANN